MVGGVATAASIAIALLVATGFSAPIALMGMTLPLVRSEYAWLSILGWVLTPVVVIAAYGWDVISQRNGLRRNRNIVLRRRWTLALLFLCGAGILIGAWHILNISVPLSEWLGVS